jgi:hypothetical protein
MEKRIEKAAPSRNSLRRNFDWCLSPSLIVVLGFQNLAPTVETVWADVVTQVHFTGGRLDRSRWCLKGGVRIVHATLRRGFLVLLNSHDCS